MSDSYRTVPEDPKRVIAALHELIEALDRRVPVVERVGETQIYEQAAQLRMQATLRIQALAEADAAASTRETGLSDATMTDDGGPVEAAGRRKDGTI